MTALAAPLAPAPADPAAPAGIERGLYGGRLDGFEPGSPAAACLLPLLHAIGWRGSARHLAEALPHGAENLDVSDLRTVLARLGYATHGRRTRPGRIDPRLLPGLFVTDDGRPLVLASPETGAGPEAGAGAGAASVFDGAAGAWRSGPAASRAGCFYRIDKAEAPTRAAATGGWLGRIAGRFDRLSALLLAVGLATNLLALAVPIFIMLVYDRVIAGNAAQTLAWLALGVGMALVLDGGLRLLRGRVLAYVGGRIDMLLGTAAFDQILALPVGMTERAPLGAQLTRLRQFESVREFFTGPLAGVALDLPFVLLFVVAIAVIGGWLAVVPLALLMVFAVLAAVLSPAMRARVAAAGEARTRRHLFLVEMLDQLRALKQSAVEPVWMARYRGLSAVAADGHRRVQAIGTWAQTAAQTLMMAGGVVTLGWGTLMVLDGALTIGGLIAVMALVWRVLAPIQVGFLSFTRLEQLRLGLSQLNRLMQLRRERDGGRLPSVPRQFRGDLAFNRVSFRYGPAAEPALLGAAFAVRRGEVVAIAGPSGAGKSTLLALAAGLYQPQAGAVTLDGLDIRQLDPAELRVAIGWVGQDCHLFHGTVAQNLRLAAPTATDGEINRAAVDAGLLEPVLALPDGFHTRLTEGLVRRLPDGFKQRLSLARAYVRRPPVYLLDEPAARLDDDAGEALMRKLQDLRGHAAVLMATHRPSHMRAADRLIWLDGGRVVDEGAPDAVLGRQMKE